jgi:Tol biopolymer transport system component
VFTSEAANLVPGDTNDERDVFVRDLAAGLTSRVSVSSTGVEGNGQSFSASISDDGRWIAFESQSTNLVVGDNNGFADVFLHDRQSGITKLISISLSGVPANGLSNRPAISGDGNCISFLSEASDLISGDTNQLTDAFVYDATTLTIERISVTSNGMQSSGVTPQSRSALSYDGRFVVFESGASNLVLNDTNGFSDIFLRDRLNGTTERVSLNNFNIQANGQSTEAAISADGRIIAFASSATNLIPADANGAWNDVFVFDRLTSVVSCESVSSSGNQGLFGHSGLPSLSADGATIAYQSGAQLVPADENATLDIYVRDRPPGITSRISVSSLGDPGIYDSRRPSVSSDGTFIAFESLASNLVPGNVGYDVFIHDRLTCAPTSFSFTRGLLLAGNLVSFAYSDDDRMIGRPGPTFSTSQDPLVIVLECTSPVQSPDSLSFLIELQASSPNVRQKIELYDFTKETYVVHDLRPGTVSDAVLVLEVVSGVASYVGPSGELRARLSYKATGPVFAYPWSAKVDQASWTFR